MNSQFSKTTPQIPYATYILKITPELKKKYKKETDLRKLSSMAVLIGFLLFFFGNIVFNYVNIFPVMAGFIFFGIGIFSMGKFQVSYTIYKGLVNLIEQIEKEDEIDISRLYFSLSSNNQEKLQVIRLLIKTNNIPGYEIANDKKLVKTGISVSYSDNSNFVSNTYSNRKQPENTCPNCGSKVKKGDRKCKSCDTKL